VFDKKFSLAQQYGVKVVEKKTEPRNGEVIIIRKLKPIQLKKKQKKTKRPKVIDASRTWHQYQELRQTKEFKKWWWDQRAYQDNLCYYCLDSLEDVVINVEHIMPMSAGGTNAYSNMVLSCQDCNKEKGAKVLSKKLRKELRQRLTDRILTKKYKTKVLDILTREELEKELSYRIAREEYNRKRTNIS
jgi:5-methylcytosine-specific restriction endonuclease McrA